MLNVHMVCAMTTRCDQYFEHYGGLKGGLKGFDPLLPPLRGTPSRGAYKGGLKPDVVAARPKLGYCSQAPGDQGYLKANSTAGHCGVAIHAV